MFRPNLESSGKMPGSRQGSMKAISPGLKMVTESIKKNAPTFKNANLIKGKKKMVMK